MTTAIDVPQALGDFMLKGWVLTDQSCPTPGCAIPMMRSPRGRTPAVTFCVKCSNGDPQAPESSPPTLDVPVPVSAASNASSDVPLSRSSTPPTEISEVPSSQDYDLPPESDTTRRRREQSDRASSEIGKKLLQGWTMLGDECPNESCYGVPLVRPPKTGGEKEQRKLCVVCGNTFTTEIDWAGRETLRPYIEKRVVNEEDSFSRTSIPEVGLQTDASPHRSTNKTELSISKPQPKLSRLSAFPEAKPIQNSPSSPSTTIDTLDETSQALRGSLQALSSRLTTLSLHSNLDPGSITSTADAINKVTQALAHVRELQRNENKAIGRPLE